MWKANMITSITPVTLEQQAMHLTNSSLQQQKKTPNCVALKFRRDAELAPSEANPELIIFFTKNNYPTNMSMGEPWWWLYATSFAYKEEWVRGNMVLQGLFALPKSRSHQEIRRKTSEFTDTFLASTTFPSTQELIIREIPVFRLPWPFLTLKLALWWTSG